MNPGFLRAPAELELGTLNGDIFEWIQYEQVVG